MSDTKPTYKLYSPGAIILATILGSPLAGAILIAMNYHRLGQRKFVWYAIGAGLLLTIIVCGLFFVLSNNVPANLIRLIYFCAITYTVMKLQDKEFKHHIDLGGAKDSWWSAIGIALLICLILFAVLWFGYVIKISTKTIGERHYHTTQGYYYEQHGQYQKAISEWDKVISLMLKHNHLSNDYQVYVHQGYDYFKLGQYKKAIDDYSNATAVDPKCPVAYNYRAHMYVQLEQYQEAINDYSKAIELDPKHANFYYYRGQAYEKLGKHDLAMQDRLQSAALSEAASKVAPRHGSPIPFLNINPPIKYPIVTDAGGHLAEESSKANVDFGPYMTEIQKSIKRNWFPPEGQESKVVVTAFKIHSDGELSDLRIDRSSGVSLADQAALTAVKNAAPFKPLPSGAPSVVDIQFTFDYHIWPWQ